MSNILAECKRIISRKIRGEGTFVLLFGNVLFRNRLDKTYQGMFPHTL